jgi:cardiolipin synthase A/B
MTDRGQGFVLRSSPAPQGSQARKLFQLVLAAATSDIHLNSPYFLPDDALSGSLCDAVRRGVQVTVMTPGNRSNHPLTRYASRRSYGRLLAAGIRIYEYLPGMIHSKILLIDDAVAVIGSTNFDHRSFNLNEEINLVVFNEMFTVALVRDFKLDLLSSHEITLADWHCRPWPERLLALLGKRFEAQE